MLEREEKKEKDEVITTRSNLVSHPSMNPAEWDSSFFERTRRGAALVLYVGYLFFSQTVTKKENKSLISDIARENKERKK